MTVTTAHLSEALQALIDSRLDTIDRMLLGRVRAGPLWRVVRSG